MVLVEEGWCEQWAEVLVCARIGGACTNTVLMVPPMSSVELYHKIK
jgi:hypothetical protein